MINTLDDYISNSLPQWGDVATNPNLIKKVDAEGRLLPYRGNTVVFLLDESTKQFLLHLQDALYQAAPDMLADRLRPDTFHMTLHDLANGSPEQNDLIERMQASEAQAKNILCQWKQMPPLHMKTTWLFNMVNTSIVLGLSPADEDAWQRLDKMYNAFETVLPLGYALTPHVTMAYFRPGAYSQWQVQRLAAALQKIDLDVSLHAGNLVLQNFSDMNHYETIL